MLGGERAQDVVALEAVARIVQRHQLGVGRAAVGGRRALAQEPEIPRGDRVAGHHDHQPLDDVAKLADVPGPRVVPQQRHGTGVDRFRRRPYSRANVVMK